MPELHGEYQYLDRPAGKRPGRFIVSSHSRFYTCEGLITPDLLKGTPIILTGEERSDGIFYVTAVRMNTLSKYAFTRYFAGRRFKQIGKITASKLYDFLAKLQTEVGAADIQDIAEEVLKEKLATFRPDGVNALPALTIVNLIREITGLRARNQLYEYCRSCAGNWNDAEILFKEYGGNAMDSLKKNPYSAVKLGLSFSFCDGIALQNGIEADSDERLSAMVIRAAYLLRSAGNSAFSLKAVLDAMSYIGRLSAFGDLAKEIYLGAVFASKDLEIRITTDNTPILFLKKDLHIEQGIVGEIRRLQNSSKDLPYDGNPGENLDSDQRKAMSFLYKTGVGILTGGPGSGKTTTIRAFISNWEKMCPGEPYFLCAPTGRAAVRIAESSGKRAYTIHKLLGYLPYTKDEDQNQVLHDRNNQFERGLFIVDEMSMVGEELFLRFLEAVPNGSLVILSGDPGQLKSVEPGNVLNDMIQSEQVPCVKLTQIHRQQGQSLIIDNYHRLLQRKPTFLTDRSSFIRMEAKTPEQALHLLLGADKTMGKGQNPYQFQILTFTKAGKLGKDAVNAQIMEARRKESDIPASKKNRYEPGDKIMMTRNNYKKGYWNGDVGVVKRITETGLQAMFYDGLRNVDSEDFRDMEHAWACTVHKAQGSEYRSIVVVVDKEYRNMLYNSILLTAITRAKQTVILITVEDADQEAIQRIGVDKRKTGLAEILKGSFCAGNSDRV